MGYDLHIVRTEDWLDASQNPIRREDIDALIASDPELTLDDEQYVMMADANGDTIRYPIVLWKGEPAFWWYKDQIVCTNPDDDLVQKLIALARTLDAVVIGDDGELYGEES